VSWNRCSKIDARGWNSWTTPHELAEKRSAGREVRAWRRHRDAGSLLTRLVAGGWGPGARRTWRRDAAEILKTEPVGRMVRVTVGRGGPSGIPANGSVWHGCSKLNGGCR
jgi:hypothetical protein